MSNFRRPCEIVYNDMEHCTFSVLLIKVRESLIIVKSAPALVLTSCMISFFYLFQYSNQYRIFAVTFVAEVFYEGHHILPLRMNSSPLWCVNMIYCPLKDSHIYTHVMNLKLFYTILVLKDRSREISVGIAARYELDSPGIESRWGRDFHTRPDRPWVPPSLLYNGYRVFTGVKQPGRGVNHPPPSRAEIKERVELYLYSPNGPSWLVLG